MRFFLPTLIFSFGIFAAPLTLKEVVLTQTRVEAEGYKLTLEVRVSGLDTDGVIKALSAATAEIKSFFPDAEGGFFNLKPVVRKVKVENATVERKGLDGFTTFTVLIRGAGLQGKLYEKLNELTERFPNLTYRVLSRRWVFNPVVKDKLFLVLHLKALQELKKRAKEYSESLNAKCVLSEVVFEDKTERGKKTGGKPYEILTTKTKAVYTCY